MIQAKVIAASKCAIQTRTRPGTITSKIATLMVTMPRFILAEFNTHRMFSRNSASSRAIPFNKMIASIGENPFIPIAWQKDHKGMQGTDYHSEEDHIINLNSIWYEGWESSEAVACDLHNLDATKQLCNRILEPYMWHTVLVTATDWENFFEQRCPQYEYTNTNQLTGFFKSKKELLSYTEVRDPESFKKFSQFTDLDWLKINKGQAEIHMGAVAEAMYDALSETSYKDIYPDEYHIPFGDQIDVHEMLTAMHGKPTSATDVIAADINAGKVAVACARCARLSYQTLGEEPKIDYTADLDLYKRLVQMGHMSPFEHVAKAMTEREYFSYGKTIMYEKRPKQLFGYLNNFQGFIQQRVLIENIYE